MEGYFRCGDYWFMRNELINKVNPGIRKLFFDPHPAWFVQRLTVGIITAWPIISISWFYGGLYLVGLGMMFPMLHDGAYYQRRNECNNQLYQEGFFDTSRTSTASMTFSFDLRLFFFVIGGIICILTLYTA